MPSVLIKTAFFRNTHTIQHLLEFTGRFQFVNVLMYWEKSGDALVGMGYRIRIAHWRGRGVEMGG